MGDDNYHEYAEADRKVEAFLASSSYLALALHLDNRPSARVKILTNSSIVATWNIM